MLTKQERVVMNKVKALRKLPSLGHTTSSSFKLWARCSKKGGWLVALKVVEDNGHVIYEGQLKTVKKLSNSGTVEITGLQSSTNYSVYIGRTKALSSLGWQDIAPLVVKTFPDVGANVSTKFVLNSCRHPAQLLSLGQKNAMLDIMSRRMVASNNFDFRIACGDQIYADHPFTVLSNGNAPTTYKRFAKCYLKNFNSTHNKIASKLPTYSTFDDHEIVNDWALSDFTSQRSHRKQLARDPAILNNGLLAYDTFQHSLNPNFSQTALESRMTANYITSNFKYWYTFEHAQTKFFAMDTRYQRIEGNDFAPDENKSTADDCNAFKQLIDPDTQLRDLKIFLSKNPSAVKFIVSAMPFIPDTKPSGIGGERALFTSPFDKWKGGHRQRKDILDYIASEHITNVFFLSGDVHCSFVAKVSNNHRTLAYNIVSSALNWPIFGLGKSSFQLGELYGAQDYSTSIISTNIDNDEGEFVEKRNNYIEVVVANDAVEISVINNLDVVSSVVKIPIE